MVQQVHVYVFGDQTYDYNAKLCDLLASKDNPILNSFFEQACYIIRAEVGRLPFAQRSSFPKFTNLADLLARQRESRDVNPAFQTALSCVYQLGCFIRLDEDQFLSRSLLPCRFVNSNSMKLTKRAVSMARADEHILFRPTHIFWACAPVLSPRLP